MMSPRMMAAALVVAALALSPRAGHAQQVVYPAAAGQPVTYAPAAPTATYAQPAAGYSYAAPATTYAQGVVPTSYTVPAAAAPAAAGDPYGFTQWLNGVRARNGLAPVAFDSSLAGWAASNNAQQQGRGIGHYVMGPARRQNSAMGSFGSIGQMWLNSPAHRATLLDPTIRYIGLAGAGMYWTLNAR